MVQRRSFLKKVGATGIALSTPIVGQSRATIDIRNHLQKTASTSGLEIDRESNATTTFEEHKYDNKAFWFMNQSSALTIREIYHTDIYGWEARVGLTSTAVSALRHRSGTISSDEIIQETGFKFTNSSDAPSGFSPPDPDQGFRGFSKSASTSDKPKLPAWVEPVFDTAVSAMVALKTSNPWTGIAAGITLSANNIVKALQKDAGKTQLDRGFKYRHVHEEGALFGPSPALTNKLSHYQRATVKMGELPVLGHVNVDARFGHTPNSGPEIGFEVHIGTCDLCGEVDKTASALSTSDDTIIDMSNPTTSQKERFGIVSVSDGTVEDEDIKSTASLNRRVERIANSVEGRNVTMVALNPPTAIKSTTRSRTGDRAGPKTGQSDSRSASR